MIISLGNICLTNLQIDIWVESHPRYDLSGFDAKVYLFINNVNSHDVFEISKESSNDRYLLSMR